jgi:hypothetical protein
VQNASLFSQLLVAAGEAQVAKPAGLMMDWVVVPYA